MVFQPQNELEKSFILAAKNPAYRPKFYKDLINSDIYVVQEDVIRGEEVITRVSKGESIKVGKIEYNGKLYIPIFTSLMRLEAVLKSPKSYVAMNCLAFMEGARGSNLFLNYGSEFCKRFTAQEVESIIDGSIWNQPSGFTVPVGTKVRLGQPAKYPSEMIAALSDFFKQKNIVKKAYLALISYDTTNKIPPHTLIGIECDNEWDEMLSEVSIVLNNVKIPNPPVDFCRLTGKKDGNEAYFINFCKPFFIRTE